MMKKICFIIPYFGTLPNYFPLFLKSCEYNPDIDWLILGDDIDRYTYPPNVHKVFMSFSEIQEKIRKKFDFEISLKAPYKLCDYKVAYGFIFEEYLRMYDFWGYCDIDLIFGNISKFITESILEQYDKIGHLGHFSLYKNSADNNTMFMEEVEGRKRYQEVFSTDRVCVFDEWDEISINDIFLKKGKKIYLETIWADIYPFDSYMRMVEYDTDLRLSIKGNENCFFYWNKCTLFANWKNTFMKNEKEVMYVHLQKRKMSMGEKSGYKQCFYIFPDKFIDGDRNVNGLYFINCTLRKIFNIKKAIHGYYTLRYWLIRTTSPLRHKIKNYSTKQVGE